MTVGGARKRLDRLEREPAVGVLNFIFTVLTLVLSPYTDAPDKPRRRRLCIRNVMKGSTYMS